MFYIFLFLIPLSMFSMEEGSLSTLAQRLVWNFLYDAQQAAIGKKPFDNVKWKSCIALFHKYECDPHQLWTELSFDFTGQTAKQDEVVRSKVMDYIKGVNILKKDDEQFKNSFQTLLEIPSIKKFLLLRGQLLDAPYTSLETAVYVSSVLPSIRLMRDESYQWSYPFNENYAFEYARHIVSTFSISDMLSVHFGSNNELSEKFKLILYKKDDGNYVTRLSGPNDSFIHVCNPLIKFGGNFINNDKQFSQLLGLSPNRSFFTSLFQLIAIINFFNYKNYRLCFLRALQENKPLQANMLLKEGIKDVYRAFITDWLYKGSYFPSLIKDIWRFNLHRVLCGDLNGFISLAPWSKANLKKLNEEPRYKYFTFLNKWIKYKIKTNKNEILFTNEEKLSKTFLLLVNCVLDNIVLLMKKAEGDKKAQEELRLRIVNLLDPSGDINYSELATKVQDNSHAKKLITNVFLNGKMNYDSSYRGLFCYMLSRPLEPYNVFEAPDECDRCFSPYTFLYEVDKETNTKRYNDFLIIFDAMLSNRIDSKKQDSSVSSIIALYVYDIFLKDKLQFKSRGCSEKMYNQFLKTLYNYAYLKLSFNCNPDMRLFADSIAIDSHEFELDPVIDMQTLIKPVSQNDISYVGLHNFSEFIRMKILIEPLIQSDIWCPGLRNFSEDGTNVVLHIKGLRSKENLAVIRSLINELYYRPSRELELVLNTCGISSEIQTLINSYYVAITKKNDVQMRFLSKLTNSQLSEKIISKIRYMMFIAFRLKKLDQQSDRDSKLLCNKLLRSMVLFLYSSRQRGFNRRHFFMIAGGLELENYIERHKQFNIKNFYAQYLKYYLYNIKGSESMEQFASLYSKYCNQVCIDYDIFDSDYQSVIENITEWSDELAQALASNDEQFKPFFDQMRDAERQEGAALRERAALLKKAQSQCAVLHDNGVVQITKTADGDNQSNSEKLNSSIDFDETQALKEQETALLIENNTGCLAARRIVYHGQSIPSMYPALLIESSVTNELLQPVRQPVGVELSYGVEAKKTVRNNDEQFKPFFDQMRDAERQEGAALRERAALLKKAQSQCAVLHDNGVVQITETADGDNQSNSEKLNSSIGFDETQALKEQETALLIENNTGCLAARNGQSIPSMNPALLIELSVTNELLQPVRQPVGVELSYGVEVKKTVRNNVDIESLLPKEEEEEKIREDGINNQTSADGVGGDNSQSQTMLRQSIMRLVRTWVKVFSQYIFVPFLSMFGFQI